MSDAIVELLIKVEAVHSPLHEDDQHIAGYYSVEVQSHLSPQLQASAALDAFHTQVAIKVLDDFEITVFDQQMNVMQESETAESYANEAFADHVQFEFSLQEEPLFCHVAVACRNASGIPDFYLAQFWISKSRYELGEHYSLAELYANENRYEGPFVSYDDQEHENIFNAVESLQQQRHKQQQTDAISTLKEHDLNTDLSDWILELKEAYIKSGQALSGRTKTIRINLVALTRYEYSFVVTTPIEFNNDDLNDLVHEAYDITDGSEYTEDNEHWEKGHCYYDVIDDAD